MHQRRARSLFVLAVKITGLVKKTAAIDSMHLIRQIKFKKDL